MKTRWLVVLVLFTSLSLLSVWAVDAQGPKSTASPEPPVPPPGYSSPVVTVPIQDLESIKSTLATVLNPNNRNTRAPLSPKALGQPGFSLRYLQSFGTVEVPYFDDSSHLNYPYGVGTDGTNVWIAESFGDRALKYASDGTFLMQIGKAGFRLGAPGGANFDSPADVAVDGNSNIWVVEYSASQVYKFNSSGGYVSALGQSWTCGTGTNQFCNPRGIDFDASGNIYVSDGGNHRIQVFNSSNTYIATIGTGVAGSANNQFNRPRHIAIYGNYLYVADGSNNRVQIWNITNPASASYYATIGTGVVGSGNDQFNYPVGVTVDANKIYVADPNNHRVQIFDRTTRAYQNTMGTGLAGSANGQFNYPTDVAVDSSGNIYVAEQSSNSRVQMFNSSLAYVRTFGTTGVPYVTDSSHYNQPSGIAIASSGNMYVTEARGHRLLMLNSAGTVQWTVGEAGVGWGGQADNNHLNYPNGVALDNSGNVYVADSNNNRVQIYTSGGTYVATLGGTSGTGPYQFNYPTGIAIDTANNIYVADQNNHRIQIYNSSRTYLGTIGTGIAGSGNSQLNYPQDVAVDSAGNIYVADRNNHRVQVFNNSYAYVRTIGVPGVSGSDFAHLSNPISVAVDAAGRTYVSDQWGGRIMVYDNTGAFLTSIGQSGGNKTGQMRQVEGLALDSQGNLYYADLLNHRLEKYAIGVPGWVQTNLNGFGDRTNGQISALTSWGGQLYAGTNSSTVNGAQLWRKSASGTWTAVMSNGFGDASNYIVENMTAFNGNLYAGTGAWDYVNNKALVGQIWRSGEGSTWNRMTMTGFDPANGEINQLLTFNNKIYASAWSYTNTHGAEIWRSDTGDSSSWARVMSNGFNSDTNASGVPAMTAFNGYLYASKGNWNGPAEVWRCSVCDGSDWNKISASGFDGSTTYTNTVAISLAAFNGYLYAGTRNWTSGAQIWRCSTCDSGSSWSQVVGPAGSIGSGFGKSSNGRVEALAVNNNALYAITYNNDLSNGMEVWRTQDGVTWQQVGFSGFGNGNNYAPYFGNSTTVFNNGLYIGTTNSANGGQIWQMFSNQLYLPLILR